MTRHRLGFAVLLAVMALVPLLVCLAPASAHVEDVAPAALAEPAPQVVVGAVPSGDGARSPLWWVVALLAAWLGLARPRRAFALGLCLVLAVFAFAAGFHSAHHLDDSPQCAIASVAVHAPVDLAASLDLEPASETERRGGAHADDPTPAARSLRPDSGRAPPVAA